MTYEVTRDVVDAFYSAYISREPQRIGAMLADDVEWHVAGPVGVMQVCGQWHGKQAVIDRYAGIVPAVITFKGLDIEALLVDGDRSAMFGRFSCVHCPSGRHIRHRIAQLVRYRDGKVVSFRGMSDSLDAAEQYVGRHIQLTFDTVVPQDARQDDLIAL